MFRSALSYPTRKPEGPRSVLIGGVLVILTFLFGVASALGDSLGVVVLLGVLPYVALRGYYVRVVRTTIGRDRPTPPAFEDAGRLLRDGLASLIISGVYLLPGVLVIAPFAYARWAGTDLGTVYANLGLPGALANAALSVTSVLVLFAAMYLIGVFYGVPVAVARFAYADRLGAAFELRTVVGAAFTEDYAVAWAVSLVLQVLLFPVAYAFRVALVGFFLHFVVAAGARYCYGQGVGAALDLEPVVPERTDADRTPATPGDARTPRQSDPGDDPVGADRGRTEPTGTAADDPVAGAESGQGESEGTAPVDGDRSDREGERT